MSSHFSSSSLEHSSSNGNYAISSESGSSSPTDSEELPQPAPQAKAPVAQGPAERAQSPTKPFTPPKIVPRKNVLLKRPLPKRTPLRSEKHAATEPEERAEQLAALHSTLLKSRAAIDQRWQEAFSSSVSSSGTSNSQSGSAELREARTSSRDMASETVTDSVESSWSSLMRSSSSSSDRFKSMLQRDSSELSLSDANASIVNLTASWFAEDLALERPASGDRAPLEPPEALIMPRPLAGVNLRLFEQSDGSSASSASSNSVERISRPAESPREPEGAEAPRAIPSLPESWLDSDDSEEESVRPHRLEKPKESESLSSGSRASLAEGRETPEEWESGVVPEQQPQAERRPRKEMPWTRTRPEHMKVDGKLDENASAEDYSRRESLDRVRYECKNPLTPNIEKLRRERLKLAEWAKRLHSREREDNDKPFPLKAPLVHPKPSPLNVVYPATEGLRPLTTELSPRGDDITTRLAQNALLPSTRVWQLEDWHERLKKRSGQQREQIRILQALLRKKMVQEGHSEATTNVSTGSAEEEELTPRTAELTLQEKHCEHLKTQIEEEHGYSEAFRAQLSSQILENVALRKRHRNACHALREAKAMQQRLRASQEGAEEQLLDLQLQAEKEATSRDVEVSCRQQREEQARAMQARYLQLVHYLREAEEKSTSYEEGLRAAQSCAEKAEALLQIKEAEVAFAKHYMASQDAQMLEKEVMLRKERDRANMAERRLQELSATVAEREAQILEGKQQIEEAQAVLVQERHAHELTKESIKELEQSLKQREGDIEHLRLEILAHRSAKAGLRRKADALAALAANFQEFMEQLQADGDDIEKWRTDIDAKRARAVALLDAAEQAAATFNLQLGFKEKETAAIAEDFQKVQAEKVAIMRRAEEEKNSIRGEVERLKNELQASRSDIKRLTMRNRYAARRVIKCASAYGRQATDTIVSELAMMSVGTTIEVLSSKGNHRPELRYMKLFKGERLAWTEDLTGKKGYKSKESVWVDKIIGIDFGPASAAYQWSQQWPRQPNKRNKGQTQPPQVSAWRFFTVRTLQSSYDFRARSDGVAEGWVIGLGRLSTLHAAPMITSRHELVVHRVRMKLDAYATQRGVPPVVLWKEAIKRTLEQMPQIRQRAEAEARAKPERDRARDRENREGRAAAADISSPTRRRKHLETESKQGELLSETTSGAGRSRTPRAAASPTSPRRHRLDAGETAERPPSLVPTSPRDRHRTHNRERRSLSKSSRERRAQPGPSPSGVGDSLSAQREPQDPRRERRGFRTTTSKTSAPLNSPERPRGHGNRDNPGADRRQRRTSAESEEDRRRGGRTPESERDAARRESPTSASPEKAPPKETGRYENRGKDSKRRQRGRPSKPKAAADQKSRKSNKLLTRVFSGAGSLFRKG